MAATTHPVGDQQRVRSVPVRASGANALRRHYQQAGTADVAVRFRRPMEAYPRDSVAHTAQRGSSTQGVYGQVRGLPTNWPALRVYNLGVEGGK